jgi:hypothetical protein
MVLSALRSSVMQLCKFDLRDYAFLKPNSWTYNFVVMFTLQTMQFQTTYAGGGGGVGDCEEQGGKLLRLLSQLRLRILPLGLKLCIISIQTKTQALSSWVWPHVDSIFCTPDSAFSACARKYKMYTCSSAGELLFLSDKRKKRCFVPVRFRNRERSPPPPHPTSQTHLMGIIFNLWQGRGDSCYLCPASLSNLFSWRFHAKAWIPAELSTLWVGYISVKSAVLLILKGSLLAYCEQRSLMSSIYNVVCEKNSAYHVCQFSVLPFLGTRPVVHNYYIACTRSVGK